MLGLWTLLRPASKEELLNRPEEFPAVHTLQGVTPNSRTGDYSDSDSDSLRENKLSEFNEDQLILQPYSA